MMPKMLYFRKTPAAGCLLLACSLATPSLAADDALSAYVRQPHSAYGWSQQSATTNASGTLFDIHFISQEWHDITWEHRLLLFEPAKPSHPNTLLLVLRQGHSASGEVEALKEGARATGTPCAFLYDIPNQPLFDGKEEDALLAYTYSQYLETGQETWPLLLPMVNSVVRAMDTIGSLGRKQAVSPVSRFVVAGHSKRAHTSWLTAR